MADAEFHAQTENDHVTRLFFCLLLIKLIKQ